MRKRFIFMFTICLLVFGAVNAAAQAPQGPPKVLRIFREDIKPGRGAAHTNLETGYIRGFQKANWPNMNLAIVSTTGPSNAWFLSGYDSFEAMEKEDQMYDKNPELVKEFDRLDEADSEFRTEQRSIVAVLRDDLSYKPAVNLPQMRYFEIITLRVRPGHEKEFNDAAKMIRGGFEKLNRDTDHFAIYQVMAGAADGTYYVFIPRRSLKELDAALKSEADFAKAIGEEDGTKLQKLISESLMSEEGNIYAFSPKMSYVTKEFAKAGGEDFWMPKDTKPMTAMKPAPRKAATKENAKKQ